MIHLTKDEKTLILQLLDQVSIKATQPDAVKMAELCKGLAEKLTADNERVELQEHES